MCFCDDVMTLFSGTSGYLKSREAVANFYSCPEAPLEAEVSSVRHSTSLRTHKKLWNVPH